MTPCLCYPRVFHGVDDCPARLAQRATVREATSGPTDEQVRELVEALERIAAGSCRLLLGLRGTDPGCCATCHARAALAEYRGAK